MIELILAYFVIGSLIATYVVIDDVRHYRILSWFSLLFWVPIFVIDWPYVYWRLVHE